MSDPTQRRMTLLELIRIAHGARRRWLREIARAHRSADLEAVGVAIAHAAMLVGMLETLEREQRGATAT